MTVVGDRNESRCGAVARVHQVSDDLPRSRPTSVGHTRVYVLDTGLVVFLSFFLSSITGQTSIIGGIGMLREKKIINIGVNHPAIVREILQIW